MSSLAQTVDGDLDISSTNLKVVYDRSESLATKLRNRLLFFLGEWFLDIRLGVPYFQGIYVKAPNLIIVRRILFDVLSNTPGVAEVSSLTLNYSPGVRELSFYFKVITDTAAVIEGGTGTPFIVQVTPVKELP